MNKKYYAGGFLVALTFCGVIAFVSPASAYIGPGLGVAAVWALFGPIAAAVTAILMLSYFPLRYYYKKYKFNKEQAALQGTSEDAFQDASEDDAKPE